MQIVFTHCPHIYQNNFREYHTIGIYCYSVKMPPKQIFWCIDSNCKKKRVNSSDFAVSCEIGGLWQHIRCGDTGKSFFLPIINIVDLYNLSSMTSCNFGP